MFKIFMNQMSENNYNHLFRIKKSSIFLFALFIYQYAVLSAVFYNLRLGPVNLQIAIAMAVLIFSAYLQSSKIIENFNWKIMVVLSLGFMFIPLKILVGKLDISGLQGMRLFYVLPLFWSLYRVYAKTEDMKKKVVNIIIWNCLFIAIFGIIHFFFFPKVFFSSTLSEGYKAGNIALVPGHSQEAAFFGNPSAYGCILITGLLGIYLTKKESLLYGIIFAIILLGAFLSASRWTVLFSVIILIMFLKDKFKLRMRSLLQLFFILILIIFILFKASPFFLTLQYAFVRWRFSDILSEGSITAHGIYTGRFPGYGVALQILFSDLSHFFFGGAQGEDIIIADIGFSDNSFIFLAIGYGVLLAILWILVVLFKIIPVRLKGKTQVFIFVFFYGTIFSTPALFWDIWLLYILGVMNVASSKIEGKKECQNELE